ncbi:hypothetical protein ACX122_16870 [Kosakonia cowanii]
MNYQTTALWFYSPYHLLLVFAVIAATFLGLTAPILYFLVIGLLFPVLVSMRLHILSENGKATLMKEREEWMVYVQGIPVHEKRASLKNPCFPTPERLRQFFMRGFIARALIQFAAIAMLLDQARANPLISYEGLAAGTMLVLLLIPLYRTARAISDVHAGKWALQEIDAATGYQAYFVDNKQVKTALDRMLAVP